MNPQEWNVSTLTGSTAGYIDGSTQSACFRIPCSFCVSSQNDIYIADRGNDTIRKIDRDRKNVYTVAGGLKSAQDGQGTNAGFMQPTALCYIQKEGFLGYLLVCDRSNHKIRKIDHLNNVTTISGSEVGFRDGPQAQALWSSPCGICVDSTGTVYVSDYGNDRIRIIDTKQSVYTLCGKYGGYKDGPITAALFSRPWGIAVNAYNDLFVCDWGNDQIRLIQHNTSMVYTLSSIDGSSFKCPTGLTLTPKGQIIVADRNNHKLKIMSIIENDNNMQTTENTSNSNIIHKKCESILLGGNNPGNKDGPLEQATFTYPTGILWTPVGDILVSSGDTIRIISKNIVDKTEDNSNTFEILLKTNNQNSVDLADFQIVASDGTIIYLHKLIISLRCPTLYNYAVTTQISQLRPSKTSFEMFFAYLYADTLPTDQITTNEAKYIENLVDLYLLSTITSTNQLSNYIAHTLNKKLTPNFPLEDICKYISRLSDASVSESDLLLGYLIYNLACRNDLDAAEKISMVTKSLGNNNFHLKDTVIMLLEKDYDHSSMKQDTKLPIGHLFSQIKSIFPLDDGQDKLEGCYPDFLIKVDDQVLPCHKLVLFSRWPYFRHMMASGLSEALSGVLEVPNEDFSASMMKSLLYYFYSDDPSRITPSDGINICKVGAMYEFMSMEGSIEGRISASPGFENLIRHCAAPLTAQITIQNCIELFKYASDYGEESRIEETRQVVIQNLPTLFSIPSSKIQFESLPIDVKYQMLSISYQKLLSNAK